MPRHQLPEVLSLIPKKPRQILEPEFINGKLFRLSQIPWTNTPTKEKLQLTNILWLQLSLILKLTWEISVADAKVSNILPSEPQTQHI